MLIKQTHLQPFQIPLLILMGTPEQINRHVAKVIGPGKSNLKAEGFGGGVTLVMPPKVEFPTIIVAFPDDPEAEAIAHEAVHVMWFIHRIHGVELGPASEEWMAYTIGYIVRTILEEYGWDEVEP